MLATRPHYSTNHTARTVRPTPQDKFDSRQDAAWGKLFALASATVAAHIAARDAAARFAEQGPRFSLQGLAQSPPAPSTLAPHPPGPRLDAFQPAPHSPRTPAAHARPGDPTAARLAAQGPRVPLQGRAGGPLDPAAPPAKAVEGGGQGAGGRMERPSTAPALGGSTGKGGGAKGDRRTAGGTESGLQVGR